MRSVLHVREGDCLIWALQSSADGYPLGVLKDVAGQTLSTCQALGFPADGELGSCPFGDSAGRTGCGFQSAPPYYHWGNVCSGCVEGEGLHKTYVKQGPIHTSSVLSSASGSTQSHCKIR